MKAKVGRRDRQPVYRRVFFASATAPYSCFFCHGEITVLEGQTSESLVVHHDDEDKNNNSPSNLKPAHHRCHTRHHCKGKKLGPHSESHRQKIGAAQIGNQRSLGVRPSAETREKMAAARRNWWERKKAQR